MIDQTHNGFHIDKRRSYVALDGAEWEAGAFLKRVTDSDGSVKVAVATGATGEVIVGMARHDRVSTVTKIEVELIAFVDGSGDQDDSQQLRGTSIDTDSVRVTDPDTGTAYTVGDDYAVTSGGLLTRDSGGAITEGSSVNVTYRRDILAREDESRFGMDYNRSHGTKEDLATVIQGNSQLFTDQYDTAQEYATNDVLYIMNDGTGRVTSQSGTRSVGYCVTPPSADNPLIEIEFNTPIPAI